MGNDWDVFDMHGTIYRILCYSCITSSYNSLFSVFNWSLSFLVLANFYVIIFNLSLASSSSFFCSVREEEPVVVELREDVAAAEDGGSEEMGCLELVVVRLEVNGG